MKKTTLMHITLFADAAQTNTFPSSGNVGIGTISPNATLNVRGYCNFSSALQVGGTMLKA